MKRSIAFLLALLMLSFCACTTKNNTPKTSAQTEELASGESTETKTEPASTETAPETGKTPDKPSFSPLLWKVTDAEGHTLYLFGTIHIGDKRSDAVLKRVLPVLESCGALAVEFDVVAYAGNTLQVARDMAQYALTDGSTISDYMPEELYSRAYSLVGKAGLFPSLFRRYNLAWWAQLVESAMQTVYTDLDAEKAFDSLLIRSAYDKGIPVLDVESSDFQMKLLNSFDDELYLMMIEEALDGADSYGDALNEMYGLWLSGGRDEFWELLEEENEADSESGKYTEEQLKLIEDYNRRLLDDRNVGMRDRALEYLSSGDTVFFAVGAAHMANEAGLVKLLTDAGCTVEQIAY